MPHTHTVQAGTLETDKECAAAAETSSWLTGCRRSAGLRPVDRWRIKGIPTVRAELSQVPFCSAV